MAAPATDARAQAAALARSAVDCLPAGELERKLAAAAADGRPLRVKLGIDPTAPDIHLGHVVVLQRLRDFQDAGHLVVLIIGDYTARVGDPSGRSEMRPVVSPEEIERNAATFQEQAFRVLDSRRCEVRRNSEWLDMPASELFALARTGTLAQLLSREDFARRHADGAPISVLELLYPLLQGYDSVAIDADVELGGTDQKFNLLLGRDVQRAYGRPEQAVLTLPILPGIDGERRMSKTLGNYIGVTEEPAEMYGKTLRLPDAALGTWYELLTGAPAPAGASARDAKRALARELVGRFHGAAAARAAEEAFDRQFVEHREPEQVDELPLEAGDDGMVHLPALIARVAGGASHGEGRRLLAQGGVRIDGEKLPADRLDMPAAELDGRLLAVGKRRFARLRRS